MIDVNKKTLNQLVEFRVGYPFRGGIDPVPGGSAAVVQMKDISSTGVLAWGAVIRTALTGRKEPEWLRSGDLLLVARGNRYYAAVLDEVPERTVCGPHLYHLRLRSDALVLPEFLAWQINQPPLQRLLNQAAEGSNQLSIRRAELEALPVSVPSRIDQQHIVNLAKAAAQERALLGQLIANRESQLGALANLLAEAAMPPRN